MIHVGFTGNRKGMTLNQMNMFQDYLEQLIRDNVRVAFHDGDCWGSDVEAHYLAKHAGCHLVGHPPKDPKLRAFMEYDEVREPKIYWERNTDIVKETVVLVAAPDTRIEKLHSGTWMTVRIARRHRYPRTVVILDPKDPVELPRVSTTRRFA